MEGGNKKINVLIAETNQLLTAMLDVVQPDFIQVTELLRRANGHDYSTRPECVTAIQNIVKELQYYDVISQKFHHILRIHDILLKKTESGSGSTSNTKTNLVRLNQLQFQVACFEYVASVAHIQENLSVPTVAAMLRMQDEKETFRYTRILLNASRKVNDNLRMLCSECEVLTGWGVEERLPELDSIYSMQSEREVLRAYLNKPLIADEELEPLNSSASNNEIDLF